MEIKELRLSGEIFEWTKRIWDAERQMPQWYKDATDAWLSCFDDFEAFVTRCVAIYGIFDGERLAGCIYFEEATEDGVLLVHLSVLERDDMDAFVDACIRIRDTVLHQGIRSIRGWVVERNKSLISMLSRIGFAPVGFFMDHGVSHGRLIRWTMIEVGR